MQHIKEKNDWLSYEFKPYFFFLIGFVSLILKKNLFMTNGQSFIAYLSIAIFFAAGIRIITWRTDSRKRASRN